MIVAVNNMPNPFFALALGLVHERILTRRNGGRHHLVPLYSIARAHAVVVLDED
jgi:hypothetical protein